MLVLGIVLAVAAGPQIALSSAAEDGKPILVATVTADGKPVEGAKVRFSAHRTFGMLPLGEEETLDDGTAAVAFPATLPGGPSGELVIIAEITAPESLAGARVVQPLRGGLAVPVKGNPFSRALWSPHAPIGLIVTLFTLLGGVWLTYAFVVRQLVAIKKGGSA